LYLTTADVFEKFSGRDNCPVIPRVRTERSSKYNRVVALMRERERIFAAFAHAAVINCDSGLIVSSHVTKNGKYR